MMTNSVQLQIVGEWQIQVSIGTKAGTQEARSQVLTVTPPPLREIVGEPCSSMPVFNPKAAGWTKGYRLLGVRTQETSAKGSLVPESLQLRAGKRRNSLSLQSGVDYQADLDWGTLGWAAPATGDVERTAFASYTYGEARIDSSVMGPRGKIALRKRTPHVATPVAPAVKKGETLIANIWLPARLARLSAENIFPVTETAYPETPLAADRTAEKLIPRTYAKLLSGEPVTILAWGDSVTDAHYLPNPESDRWQAQFVTRLREKFPKARITLLTEAWGGRNTDAYRAEPPGSPHNYKEKVLAVKPDLIVSEFVNDGWLSAEQTQAKYGVILGEFREIGAEWIILTPHYILPEWMGVQRQREIDDDPRAYVKGLRTFAAANKVALADASLRWGRLWRQGIPYMTLMMNAINHPNAAGMKLFADSLMELF